MLTRWIPADPQVSWSRSRQTPQIPEEPVFQLAQESDPELATFIMLAASSGARRGELLALRWSDIDLDRAKLSVERGIVRVGNDLIEQGTKTHQSRRSSLDAGTIAVLKAHEDRMIERAHTASVVITPESFVFSRTVDGSSPWHPDSTSRAFRKICQQAGVKGVRLHDLRHYVATRLLTAGVDVRTVAGRLGHRNPSTTLNVYSHFVPETDQQAADALEQIFESANSHTHD